MDMRAFLNMMLYFKLLTVMYAYLYQPFNVSFNSTGFKWNRGGYAINIPEFDRGSFTFTSSSIEPCTETKYGIRVLSLSEDRLLTKTIYVNKYDNETSVTLNRTNIKGFRIVLRALVRIPIRYASNNGDNVWAISDTDVLYAGEFNET